MKPKRVAIYTRVSTDYSIAKLRHRRGGEHVERARMQIYKIYSDRAVSGASTTRPALNELIVYCRRHKFDVLLVARLDRHVVTATDHQACALPKRIL